MRVLPAQLSGLWDLVRFGVARSIPAHVKSSQEAIRGVLESLLADRAQLWVLYQPLDDDPEGRKEMHAMLVSCIEQEQLTGVKFMNLWAMYAFRPTPLEGWDEMRRVVEAFARDQGCNCISAMTVNPKAAALAVGLGASERTFLVKELSYGR